MWRLPLRPLASPHSTDRAESDLVRSIPLDLPFLIGCWALATWALWQHRLLPLAVCVGAAVLALLDARERTRDQTAPPSLASRSTQ